MPNDLTVADLREMQAKDLEWKEQQTLALISEWYAHWQNKTYVSFSGGKDSTVVAYIAAKWCKIAGIPLQLIFVDTGLEFPEIKEHVRNFAEYLRGRFDLEVNLEIVRPKMVFSEVIKKYGYPVISKEVSHKVYSARRGGGVCETIL